MVTGGGGGGSGGLSFVSVRDAIDSQWCLMVSSITFHICLSFVLCWF